MRRRTLALTWKLACLAALCMSQVRANVASAADSSEIWPQVSAFVGLGPRTRLYLDAAYAEGKESDTQSLERPLSCVCANDCSWPILPLHGRPLLLGPGQRPQTRAREQTVDGENRPEADRPQR